MVGEGTLCTEVCAHPKGRVRWTGSFHDYISALANSECDYVGCVWLDWYEVVRHHCHVVVVDGEALETFGSAVDKSESVLLS